MHGMTSIALVVLRLIVSTIMTAQSIGDNRHYPWALADGIAQWPITYDRAGHNVSIVNWGH